MAENHTITITAASGDTLTLNPSDPVSVDPGDTVTWEVGNNVNITITGISEDNKPNNSNIFAGRGPQPTDSTNKTWQGTVRGGTKGQHEEYTISWNDSAGNPHSMDPRLDVRN